MSNVFTTIKNFINDKMDIIFLVFMSILTLIIFLINYFKVYNFVKSRYNKVMEPVSTKMNINESLNKEYCNINLDNNLAINNLNISTRNIVIYF